MEVDPPLDSDKAHVAAKPRKREPFSALHRSVVEDMVQRLVDLLDDLDGNPDDGPANDDKPTLGVG